MPRRMLVTALLAAGFVLPAMEVRSSSPDQCFGTVPSVADCLQGRFAEYWQANGGLPVFGYPITPLFDAPTRDGLVLAQMVERNRLEYHPEHRPPYDLLLGRLGEDLLIARGRDWRSQPRAKPVAGCRYAQETGHNICDQEPGLGFLTYYRTHGLELGDSGISQRESLALWGLPLTEAAIETNAEGDTVLTQWFERARFEYHPHNPAQYRVLLGLLGREAWGTQSRPRASYQAIPAALQQKPAGQTTPHPTASLAPSLATATGTVSRPTSVPKGAVAPGTTPTATRTRLRATPTTSGSAPLAVPTDTWADPPATPADTWAEPLATPTATSAAFAATPTILKPTIETVSSPAMGDGELKQRLFELVDALHQQAGCRPYLRDGRLDTAAQAHAADIAAHKRVSHTGTDGATLRERYDGVGYPYNRASESIGIARSPEEAANRWMDEGPNGPHRLNITNCQYTDVGIGLSYDNRGLKWWVMDVASRRAGY